jgi:hypothetical protein
VCVVADVDACTSELLNARIDGNRNILHAALLQCQPIDNRRNADNNTIEQQRSGNDASEMDLRRLYEGAPPAAGLWFCILIIYFFVYFIYRHISYGARTTLVTNDCWW